MEERSFGVQMRELADKSSRASAFPRPDPVIAPDIIERLIPRIKQEIRACASQGGYYCPFLLYGKREGEIGFFESQEEAMLAGDLLASRFEIEEEIEAVVKKWIGAVTLELAWRKDKESLSGDFET